MPNPTRSNQTRTPRVSICLPNLNNRAYLEERLDTIFRQSFSDWELVIYDNYSEDGAWQFFQEAANQDDRLRIQQAPREGMYANWNNCVRAARGEYVYIATSDDTMAENCVEELVAALDAHPECDLAHCKLREIDENGRDCHDWWSRESLFALSSGELLNQRHTRRPPFDGLLHLCGDSVYTSITQLLIRRSLFSRVGLFESRWGSIGDFNWNMRAGSVARTVHVPETWGGWRRHSAQATARAGIGGAEHLAQTDDMIEHALLSVEASLTSQISKQSISKLARRTRDMRHFMPSLRAQNSSWSRRRFIAQRLLSGSWAARWHVTARAKARYGTGQPLTHIILRWLEAQGIESALVPLQNDISCLPPAWSPV
jgi:hypothetical protein